MGEAKKRKQLLGQGYWNPQTIGVYISKSHQTNKHMIWIGVRQGNDLQVYPITAHYKISATWHGKTQVQEALKVFQTQNLRMDLNDLATRRSFLLFVNEHFNYPNDDQVLLYNRRANAITCVEGEETLEWYVEALSIEEDEDPLEDKNFFGDPEGFCTFIVKASEEKIFTVDNNICLFSSYVTAAHIADRLNEDPAPLLKAEYLQIWRKSQLMQGKI
jgi:hypothetical protein